MCIFENHIIFAHVIKRIIVLAEFILGFNFRFFHFGGQASESAPFLTPKKSAADFTPQKRPGPETHPDTPKGGHPPRPSQGKGEKMPHPRPLHPEQARPP